MRVLIKAVGCVQTVVLRRVIGAPYAAAALQNHKIMFTTNSWYATHPLVPEGVLVLLGCLRASHGFASRKQFAVWLIGNLRTPSARTAVLSHAGAEVARKLRRRTRSLTEQCALTFNCSFPHTLFGYHRINSCSELQRKAPHAYFSSAIIDTLLWVTTPSVEGKRKDMNSF